jgi:peptidoglycan hydrolase CwlO-like protein
MSFDELIEHIKLLQSQVNDLRWKMIEKEKIIKELYLDVSDLKHKINKLTSCIKIT